jgi:exopolyphosphatase
MTDQIQRVDKLNTFLKKASEQWNALKDDQTVHVVMGNEASDMDSIVTSIVYANYLATVLGNDKNIYIPIMNIPKEGKIVTMIN